MKNVYDVIVHMNPGFGWWDGYDSYREKSTVCTLSRRPVTVPEEVRAKYEERYPRLPSPLDQLR